MDLKPIQPSPNSHITFNKKISPMTLLAFLCMVIGAVTYRLYPEYAIIAYLLWILASIAFWQMIKEGKKKE